MLISLGSQNERYNEGPVYFIVLSAFSALYQVRFLITIVEYIVSIKFYLECAQVIRLPSEQYVCWIVRTRSSRPAKTALCDCGLCVTALMALQGLFHLAYDVVALKFT